MLLHLGRREKAAFKAAERIGSPRIDLVPDPSLLGPLFRFNREYYQLDDRGRPEGYRSLEQLRERVGPILLRRRKTQVETEFAGPD